MHAAERNALPSANASLIVLANVAAADRVLVVGNAHAFQLVPSLLIQYDKLEIAWQFVMAPEKNISTQPAAIVPPSRTVNLL